MTDDINSPPPAAPPQGLPEQFWDSQAGAVKLPELVKSYGEAAALKADHETRLAVLPKNADDYKIEINWPSDASDDAKQRLLGLPAPEGFELGIDPADPRIGPLRQLAHKHQLSQEAVSELLWLDARARAAAIAESNAGLQQAIGKLGANAEKRISALEADLAAPHPRRIRSPPAVHRQRRGALRNREVVGESSGGAAPADERRWPVRSRTYLAQLALI